MKNYILGSLALSLLALFNLSSTASAQIIYNNGAATYDNGYSADTATSGVASGNVFTATTTGTALSIQFSGLYGGNFTNTPSTSDSFTVNLYSVTNAGAPGTLITSTLLTNESRTIVGPPPSGFQDSFYTFTGNLASSLSLTAGTKYFLDISDDSTPNSGFDFGTSSTGGTEAIYEKESSGGFFEPGHENLSFQLSASSVAAPEPSTYAMLFGGLLVLVFAVRRKSHAV
jgi:hypothetical protein